MTSRNDKSTIEVVTMSEERRRRWSPSEKAEFVRQTYEPGMNVSLVAHQHGDAASQLFNWRKLDRERALTAASAGKSVVSWFNNHRLLEPIGYIPPAEAEANYYRQLANQAIPMAA